MLPQALIDEIASVARRIPQWEKVLAERADSVWLAFVDSELVAFADGGSARTREEGCDGQLFGIYSLQSAQRKGAGRGLVQRVFADLRNRGFSSARVEVLRQNNNAIAFYERLGARHSRDVEITLMQEVAIESVYVWSDLTSA